MDHDRGETAVDGLVTDQSVFNKNIPPAGGRGSGVVTSSVLSDILTDRLQVVDPTACIVMRAETPTGCSLSVLVYSRPRIVENSGLICQGRGEGLFRCRPNWFLGPA